MSGCSSFVMVRVSNMSVGDEGLCVGNGVDWAQD